MTPDEAIKQYFTLTDTLALFYHGPCSQWWASKFKIGDTWYNCMEQFMMAKKAQVFGDWATHDLIMKCVGEWNGTQKDFNRYPQEQKRLGRFVTPFNEDIWNAVNMDLIYRGSMARWEQDALFRGTLAGVAAGRVVVETSPSDRIWGIGLDRKDPDALDPDKWRGENRLGRVLTMVNITVSRAIAYSDLSP